MGAQAIPDLLRQFDVEVLEYPGADSPGLVQIVDHKGEVLSYFVQLRLGGVVRFRKSMAEGGEQYDVTVRDGLPAACQCPDWIYRRRKRGNPQWACKHMACAYLVLYPPFPEC